MAVVWQVVVIQRSSILLKFKKGPQNGGHCKQVVAIRMWSLTQVWLLTQLLLDHATISNLVFYAKNRFCIRDLLLLVEGVPRAATRLLAADQALILVLLGGVTQEGTVQAFTLNGTLFWKANWTFFRFIHTIWVPQWRIFSNENNWTYYFDYTSKKIF